MKTTTLSILTRAAVVATMAAVLLAFTGLAQASAINAGSQKFTTGTLKIAAPIEVGGTLLQPGSYEVKVRNSGGSSIAEFARWNYNPYAQEGLPVWEREVVATVPALPQTISSAPARTELLLSSNSSKAAGLQIRGNNVDYVF